MTGLIAMNKAYLMLAFTNHKHDVCWGLVLAYTIKLKWKMRVLPFALKMTFLLYMKVSGEPFIIGYYEGNLEF